MNKLLIISVSLSYYDIIVVLLLTIIIMILLYFLFVKALKTEVEKLKLEVQKNKKVDTNLESGKKQNDVNSLSTNNGYSLSDTNNGGIDEQEKHSDFYHQFAKDFKDLIEDIRRDNTIDNYDAKSQYSLYQKILPALQDLLFQIIEFGHFDNIEKTEDQWEILTNFFSSLLALTQDGVMWDLMSTDLLEKKNLKASSEYIEWLKNNNCETDIINRKKKLHNYLAYVLSADLSMNNIYELYSSLFTSPVSILKEAKGEIGFLKEVLELHFLLHSYFGKYKQGLRHDFNQSVFLSGEFPANLKNLTNLEDSELAFRIIKLCENQGVGSLRVGVDNYKIELHNN